MSYIVTSGVMDTLGKSFSAASKVIEDPYLPEVADLVLELHALEQPKAKPGKPPSAPVKGVGLSRVVKPLRFYVGLRRKGSWVVPAILAGTVGLIFATGYLTGRKKR